MSRFNPAEPRKLTIALVAIVALVACARVCLAQADPLTGYVSNTLSGTISVIDLRFPLVTSTIEVGALPRKLVVSTDFEHAYAAVRSPDGVAILNIGASPPHAGTVVKVGNDPEAVALVGDRFLYVTNRADGTVSVVDVIAQAVVAHINVGTGPAGAVATATTRLVYVANSDSGTVSVINADVRAPGLNRVIETFEVGSVPVGMAITPDDRFVYVTNFASNSLSIIDAIPMSPGFNTVIATVGVGASPVAVAVADVPGRGQVAYVANFADRTLSVIDAVPTSPTFTHMVRTVAVDLPPTAIAIAPSGVFAFVTQLAVDDQGSVADGFVSQLFTDIDEVSGIRIPVGDFPIGIALAEPPLVLTPTVTSSATPTRTPTVTETPTPAGPCVEDDDCAPGQVCVDGSCMDTTPTLTPTPAGHCVEDNDCPPGQACVDRRCVTPPPTSTPSPVACPPRSNLSCPPRWYCVSDVGCHLLGCPPDDRCCSLDSDECFRPGLATHTPTAAPTPPATEAPKCDGRPTAAAIVVLLRHLIGADANPSARADANCDGHVDAADLQAMVEGIFAPSCPTDCE